MLLIEPEKIIGDKDYEFVRVRIEAERAMLRMAENFLEHAMNELHNADEVARETAKTGARLNLNAPLILDAENLRRQIRGNIAEAEKDLKRITPGIKHVPD